jgi:hypothetical protein
MIPTLQLGQIGRARNATGGGGAGNFPVILSVTATAPIETNSSTHSLTLPGTINAGDLLVMYVYLSSGAAISLTTPAGWSKPSGGESGTTRFLGTLYKVATGSEGATLSITATASRCIAYCVRIQAGTYTGTPEAANTGNTSSASVACAPVSPSWGAAASAVLAGATAQVTGSVTAYPLGSNQATSEIVSANAFDATICSGQSSASTISPGTFTFSGSGTVIRQTTVVVRGT